MSRRIAPSLEIEEAIEQVLLGGLDDIDRLGELGRLGAQLVLHRAVEEEVTAFLGRARYERTLESPLSRDRHPQAAALTARRDREGARDSAAVHVVHDVMRPAQVRVVLN